MLANNKYAAITQFKALQSLVAGTHLADDIQTLAAMLRDMRFDEVLTDLRRIAADQAGHGTETTTRLAGAQRLEQI